MTTLIKHNHYIGDIVYIKTDPDQKKRMVTTIIVNPGDVISYDISPCPYGEHFFEFELTTDVDTLATTTN